MDCDTLLIPLCSLCREHIMKIYHMLPLNDSICQIFAEIRGTPAISDSSCIDNKESLNKELSAESINDHSFSLITKIIREFEW